MRAIGRGTGTAIVLSLVVTAPAAAVQEGSALLALVEDSHGAPLSGAVISLFGRGLNGGGVVALTDAAGRVFLPSLPPGSYTLRALRAGHVPAPARRITVLPDRDATFTVALKPLAEQARERAAAASEEDSGSREWRWLTRHKRRSVLENRRPGEHGADEARTSLAHAFDPELPDLGGTLEVLTTPGGVGLDVEPLGPEEHPASVSLLRLDGRFASSGRWSLGGLLSESEGTTWRMAAEFVIAPGSHEIEAGMGYGTSFLRPLPAGADGRGNNRSMGAMFVQDRWQLTESLATTVGGRFSYAAYLGDASHIDPLASVQYRPDERTRVTATASARTLLPGGDLLALSSIASAPALAVAVLDETLRAEKVVRYEVAVDQTLGATTVRAYTYHEGARSPLRNVFTGPARVLHIDNAPPVSSRGMGMTVARRFGDGVQGSITYSKGQGWSEGDAAGSRVFTRADFHDLVARLEAALDWSDTRVSAFYRLNSLQADEQGPVTTTRFDIQLSQRLPFLGGVTRADWDLLLAVRNLYYEADEGAVLDEVVVVDPPRRVLGGISVRF